LLENVKPKLFLCVITIHFDELSYTDVERGYRTVVQTTNFYIPLLQSWLHCLPPWSVIHPPFWSKILWLPDFAYLNYLTFNECVCYRNLLFPALNTHLEGIQIENDNIKCKKQSFPSSTRWQGIQMRKLIEVNVDYTEKQLKLRAYQLFISNVINKDQIYMFLHIVTGFK